MMVRRAVIAVVAVAVAVVVIVAPQRLTLLMGFAGQVSLGQGAFFGIGAYTVGLLTAKAHWNPWLALIVAPVVTMLVGYLFGLPLLRLRGHHLAVATLAMAIIVYTLLNNLRGLTGGPIGLHGIRQPGIGGTVLTGERLYYGIWIVAALSLVLCANIVRSRPGRGLRAIAQN